MAGEWETIPLESLVEPGRGISYGIVQPGAAVADGVPIVRVTDVRHGRISTSDPLKVAPQIEAPYARTRLSGGELLLTLVGTVGESAIVPESLRGWNVARAVAVIPVRKEIGAYWVRVALKSPTVRHMIDSRLNTTVQATLNLRDVAQLPIVLPPQGERERIAHILGTLDDKIELNRRMNETLEAMARALFKSWFVDFDPVRAKSEGRLPAGRQATPAWPRQGQWCVYALECEDRSFYIGHTENLERRFEDHSQGKGADWTRRHPPKRVAYWEGTATQAAAIERERKLKSGSGREWLKLEIARRDLASGRLSKPPCLPNRQVADLFPDSFEDSALGEIPKGWEVKGLDEIARFVNGLALQKFPPVGERSLPVIKIAQLRAGNTTSADRASAELEPDYIVQDGDILFSWSGSLECVLWAGGAGALNQHLFKVTSTTHPRWLCYLGIHQHLHDFRHVAAGKATTMGHIQRRHLSDAMIAVPPEPLLRAASLLLEPMMDLLWKRNVESRTLGALRDTLLPKLISGELRLSDTERFTEEATA